MDPVHVDAQPRGHDHDLVRIITLVATGVAFIMATSVTRAFGSEAFWFVVPYLVVRLLGLGLQVRIDLERGRVERGSVAIWASLSLIGLTLVLAGAFVDPPGAQLDLVGRDRRRSHCGGERRSGDGRDWDIRPAHFSERHGLFVIIALGESLIVAATAVSSAERTWALMSDVIAALVIVCLLWWTYFGWLKEAAEEDLARAGPTKIGPLARDAYSLGHFPLVCGIVAFSVAVEEIVHHPAHAPSGAVVAALGVGVSLFVGSSAFFYWRVTGRVLVARLVILAATMVALALVSSHEPIWLLVTVAIGVLVIVVTEARTEVGARSLDHEDSGIPPSDG